MSSGGVWAAAIRAAAISAAAQTVMKRRNIGILRVDTRKGLTNEAYITGGLVNLLGPGDDSFGRRNSGRDHHLTNRRLGFG